MQEFLNPKSMVTPGIAGGMVMLLANGLCDPFPELPVRYVALGLSLALGAVTFRAAALKLHQRTVYWLLNSLVIFVVGYGANSFGRESTPQRATVTAPAEGVSLARVLFPPAYAQEPPRPAKEATPGAKAPAPAKNGAEPGKKDGNVTTAVEKKEKAPFFKKW